MFYYCTPSSSCRRFRDSSHVIPRNALFPRNLFTFSVRAGKRGPKTHGPPGNSVPSAATPWAHRAVAFCCCCCCRRVKITTGGSGVDKTTPEECVRAYYNVYAHDIKYARNSSAICAIIHWYMYTVRHNAGHIGRKRRRVAHISISVMIAAPAVHLPILKSRGNNGAASPRPSGAAAAQNRCRVHCACAVYTRDMCGR